MDCQVGDGNDESLEQMLSKCAISDLGARRGSPDLVKAGVREEIMKQVAYLDIVASWDIAKESI